MASAGEVVLKNELMDRIWPNQIVNDNTLQAHIAALRKALGPRRALLKTEPGRGYRLLGDWARLESEPADRDLNRRPAAAASTNFPAPVTDLIGRSHAVQRVRDLLSASRVVTLTGPGGIGKTTLALNVARGAIDEFADGGFLIELASLSDSDLVASTVAGALGLNLGSGEISAAAIGRAVGEKNLLLLLDNCEHLIDAIAPLTETIVHWCRHVTVLTTSREALRIEGEYVYRVAPLDVPSAGEESEGILRSSAVALFVTRLTETGSRSGEHYDELSLIADISRHLDGIPLAIELAAARAATLGVYFVATSLADRFAILGGGRRTALPRHQTLRAALDWSYELLSEAQRELLRRLAIFAGPFSLEAAGAVAAETMAASEIAGAVADGRQVASY
ncbi:MAG: winged helix-turn-helix domain-containing protein [Acetobacteraceae bacterium]|nr:winged helix-turn-helix domain-containing protein [Acetobacteraceae bacterium]